MSLQFRFSYHFFPVGQGLFSAGTLLRENEDDPSFLWVYDCGTSSSQNLIGREILELETLMKSHRVVDLLTLSHFDRDHISGVCKLLKKFRVRTLMLPYMPLAQRLIVAYAEGSGGPKDLLAMFFLNPVSYLRSIPGAHIDRILFVPGSGGEGPPPSEGPSSDQPLTPVDESNINDIVFVSDKPMDIGEIGPLLKAADSPGFATRVDFLRKGKAIIYRSIWEFIPYNDDPEVDIPEDFKRRVNLERTRLLDTGNETTRDEALKELKNLYNVRFGKSHKGRNAISIFLYSGPVYTSWHFAEIMVFAQWFRRIYHLYHRHSLFLSERASPCHRKCSAIYTGDGYLDTPARLQRLVKYFNQIRIEKAGLFQVMHHGSRANWFKGVAASISPCFSIFSSDPKRKNWEHPHPPVLRDFWLYEPIQVDKQHGFHCVGVLVRK